MTKTKIYLSLSVFTFVFLNLVCSDDVDLTIPIKIQEEINAQLSSSDLYADSSNDSSRFKKRISSSVKREISKQICFSYPDIIYKVPTWPIQSAFFIKKDMVRADLSTNFATQAYGSSGSTKDISNHIFQSDCIRLKDILLASKLIDEGVAEPVVGNKYNFLRVLKDQSLFFDASTNFQELAFSYIRHFLGGDVSLGLKVPIVRKKQKIRLRSCLTTLQNATLKTETLESSGKDFFSYYPNGLIDLFKDVLCKKNISFNENDTEVGIGDVEAFCDFEIMSKYFERGFVGLRALFPTSRRRDIYKLWDVELGNGGFPELSLYGSLFWRKHRFFNPHVFSQLTYAISSRMFRRVPKLVSKDDLESSATTKFGDDFMFFGNGIKHVAAEPDFCQLDSTVLRFADCARKTKINRGGSFFLRLGNMIDKLFFERVFLDVFYDLYMKGKDYIGFQKCDEKYKPSILTNGTFETKHRIGLDVSYQPDDSWRLRLGGLYVFSGRNTYKLFEINGSVSFEF